MARITAEDVLRPGSRWRDCEVWDGLLLRRDPDLLLAPDFAPSMDQVFGAFEP